MQTQFGGARIHFEATTGSGPAVMLLHGFPLRGAMWRRQVAELSDRFRVIVPDFPGFGRSTPTTEQASMDLFAQAALAVLDAAGVERAAVVGLSMGGYVAFALQSRAPERVAALALCDTRAAADSPDARRNRELTARAVEENGTEILIERMLPGLLSATASEAVRREAERLISGNPPEGAAAALRAMARRHDFTTELPAIACPTLALAGAADGLTPPAEIRALAEAIPGAQFVELADAGHLSNLEQPQAFNLALGSFLDRVLAREAQPQP